MSICTQSYNFLSHASHEMKKGKLKLANESCTTLFTKYFTLAVSRLVFVSTYQTC